MKNKFFVLGMAALLLFTAVLAGCKDDPIVKGAKNIYKLVATASGEGGTNRQIINVDIIGDAGRSARAAVPNGQYEYSLALGGITISSGSLVINGDLYTFTPANGTQFTFNSASNTFTGSILLNAQIKQAISQSAGTPVVLPDSLSVDSLMETRSNSGSYWDGTWRRMKEDSTDFSMTPADHPQKITFNGINYTLTNKDGTVETGTFVYTNQEDPDSVFIFSRNVSGSPSLAAYFWEGMNASDDVNNPPFLELYNWLNDTMDVAPNNVTDDRWFEKE